MNAFQIWLVLTEKEGTINIVILEHVIYRARPPRASARNRMQLKNLRKLLNSLPCSCSCSCSHIGWSLHQKDAHPKRTREPGIFSYIRILKTGIGERMLSSPPASLLPRFGRNQFRAGRRTKTAIRVNACLARRPCQNQIIADSQQWTHIENQPLLNVIDPDWEEHSGAKFGGPTLGYLLVKCDNVTTDNNFIF